MELVHDYFESNLELLKKHHPEACRAVMEYTETLAGDFSLAANGQINLLIHGSNGEEILLHDAQNPEAELEIYYGLVPEACTGVVVFVGMGLGYSPLAMIQSRPQIRRMAIIEPETGIFIQALHALELSELFTDKRLIVAVGNELDASAVMASMYKALILEGLYILNHLPSSRLNPQVYQAIYDEVYKQGNTLNTGGMTTRAYGGKFIENRIRNMSAIHHQHLLEHLKDAFAGVPAIIVAGGPSLNKNIHLLSEAKGKAVIIGVDTVFPALVAHDVVPDFVTSIDMQEIVIEKIVGASAAATDTSLVCASWVCPSVTKNFPARQVYWMFAAKHMEGWLNDLLGGTLLTAGASTVAHLNFNTAFLLGCSPIIFVGQDLSYPEGQDHVISTVLTEKDGLKRLYEANEIQWIEGYGDVGKVPTTRGWLSDKHHFEHLMAASSDREFINATEGGVRLAGTKELSLQEVLNHYCQQKVDVATVVNNADQRGGMPDRRRMLDEFTRQAKTIDRHAKDMNRLESVAVKLGAEIARLKKQGRRYNCFDTLPNAVKRQIGELDDLNAKLDKAQIWRLLDEVTMDGLLQSERLDHEISLLEDKAELYLEWIAKHIGRFLFINQCRRQVLASFKRQLQLIHNHLQREDSLLAKLGKEYGDSGTIILELLRLYYDNGDHVLLEKTIETQCHDHTGSVEILFYLGTIAAYRSQFDQAEQYFERAMGLDPSWAPRIAECRKKLGDQYLAFGQDWQCQDRDVARRMFFKGIRHCPEHSTLRESLAGEAGQLVDDANAAASQGILSEMTERLSVWSGELFVNPGLVHALGIEMASTLHRLTGSALVGSQEYLPAIDAFAGAIDLTPQAPDLHLLQADAFFATHDFVGGTTCLDRAVAIDRSYAKYYENMGDNLFASAQPSDALAAYEKCFLSLPREIGLLKKMGDCYLAQDQVEAALAAYQQFKARLESTTDVLSRGA